MRKKNVPQIFEKVDVDVSKNSKNEKSECITMKFFENFLNELQMNLMA